MAGPAEFESATYSLTGSYSTVELDTNTPRLSPRSSQLQTIERLVHLYSKKGDTVLTPFMGIGSEVYQAVKMGRKGVGFELKESYFELAKANVKSAIKEKSQLILI